MLLNILLQALDGISKNTKLEEVWGHLGPLVHIVIPDGAEHGRSSYLIPDVSTEWARNPPEFEQEPEEEEGGIPVFLMTFGLSSFFSATATLRMWWEEHDRLLDFTENSISDPRWRLWKTRKKRR